MGAGEDLLFPDGRVGLPLLVERHDDDRGAVVETRPGLGEDGLLGLLHAAGLGELGVTALLVGRDLAGAGPGDEVGELLVVRDEVPVVGVEPDDELGLLVVPDGRVVVALPKKDPNLRPSIMNTFGGQARAAHSGSSAYRMKPVCYSALLPV